MSHLFKTGNSIFKVGNNIYKINDRLNVVVQNKGGFGAVIEGLRFDPVSSNSRMAIASGSTCRIVNTNTFELLATINFPGSCIGFAWDNANNSLYVTAGGKLYIVDTTSWVAVDSGLVSGSYNGVALDPNPSNRRLIITGGSKLQFYDIAANKITTTMATGFSGAYGLAFDPLNPNHVYVGNYGSNYISIVDTDNFSIVETVAGFGAPIDIAFDPNSANNRYIVSEYSLGQVAYVNRSTNGIIKRSTITAGPEGISFDPSLAVNRFIVASATFGQYFIVTELIA